MRILPGRHRLLTPHAAPSASLQNGLDACLVSKDKEGGVEVKFLFLGIHFVLLPY